ncbi:hypothetical protein ACFL3S_07730 [Gemmatimonadota bacterium]
MSSRSLRQGWVLPLLVSLSVASCGGDGGGTTGPEPTPTISISVSPTSVTVDPGAPVSEQATAPTADITVSLTRGGGYTGAVTVRVEGLPSGVSASPVTIASGSTSGTLELEATSLAAAGTYSLTIRASGSGVTDATATVSMTVTEPPQPGFSIAVDPASVSIEQGKSTSTNVNVTRTNGFSGDVALVASGQPTGLTISFNPASVSGDASLVQVAAGLAVTPGTYAVTVTGTSSGLPDATASLSVEVTASSGTGETVTLTYCDASGIPTWLAVKDGEGPWVPVTPVMPAFGGPSKQAAATYEFEITSDRAGVATVMESGGSANLNIFFAGRDELWFQGLGHCPGAGIFKTATGTVAGAGLTDQANISVGGASTTVFGNPNYTITNIPDGTVDLVASLVTLNAGGGGFTADLQKLIIRRNLNPPDNTVFPVLDFGSGEAFDPVTQNLTINNLGADAAVTSMSYQTANGGAGLFFTDFQPAATGTRTFPGVPGAQQAPGDFHSLFLLATDPNATSPDRQRTATLIFHQAADQTVNLGPDLNVPTITVPAVNPYAMFRAQVQAQDEYDQFTFVTYWQNGGRNNSAFIGATAAYLNGMDLDLTIPNFSGLTGWSNDWGPELGIETNWSVFGMGWTGSGGITGNPFEEGSLGLGAGRIGTITP